MIHPPLPAQYSLPTYLPHPQTNKKVTYLITFPLVLILLLHTPTKNFFFLIKNLDTLGITSSPNYWTTETPKLILGYTTSANQLWWSIHSLDGEVGDLGFNVCFLSFFFFVSLLFLICVYAHMHIWRLCNNC